jgi:hypothetical protein
MKTFKKLAYVIIVPLLSLTLFSCGHGGGGGGGNPPATTVITGQVVDAFVAGATVTAYQVNADGTRGAQIGTPVQTDQSGNYTLNLGTYFGPVIITSTGGTFTDTATGNTLDLTNSTLTLSAIVPNASGYLTAQINPLTTMAANVAVTLAGQGIPLATAADAANTTIQDYFGLLSPILDTALVNLTTTGCMTGANQTSADVSAILAGISQLASDNGVSPLDLVEALIQDVTSDGLFDGSAGGTAISISLTSGSGTISLSTIEGSGLTGLATAITTFMNSSTSNVCGASVDSGVISALSDQNIFTTPAAPTGVTAAAGEGSVLISWNTVTSATSYNVYMAASPGVTPTSTQLSGYRSILNVTSPYTVSGLTTGTTYYFVVTAVSGASPYAGSESAPSAEVSATITTSASPGTTNWAKSVTAGGNQSIFSSLAVASDGSVYAAGYGIGTGAYNFGNNVTAAGTADSYNILLVKYNSSGSAQWAKTVTAASAIDYSQLYSVSVGPDGSVYAAGYLAGADTFNFGNSVTAAGTSTTFNLVLVKYNSSGVAQWARTVTGGSSASAFYSVSVGSDGSVYAAGSITGTGTYNFGNSVTASGRYTNGNLVLVKYNSSGAAQWAQTVTAGSGVSSFEGVSVASDGSVCAAGHIAGTGTYSFGNSVTAAGTYGGYNLVLVKYNSSGVAQWARTVTGGSSDSDFYSVTAASDGSVYAAGRIAGAGTYNFGNSVTAAGTSTSNLVLVKYNSTGAAQWAQTVSGGSDDSQFNSVSMGPDGSVFAAGYIAGTGTYDFGNSVTVAGTNSSFNVVLVSYDSSGVAKWAQTVTGGSSDSDFYGVTAASDGSVYAAGFIAGAGTYSFGNGVTAAGKYSLYNIVLVKYTTVLFTPTITATAGPNGSISPSGSIPVTYNGSQTFTVSANAGYIISAVLVDGVPVSGQSNTTFNYTFANVTANHTISATFEFITGGSGGTGF